MPSQIVMNKDGIFVWIDQPFNDDALSYIDQHLPNVGPDIPIFVFIKKSGSGDMESYFFQMRDWGYDVKFRWMTPGNAQMIELLKLPTHEFEWPRAGEVQS